MYHTTPITLKRGHMAFSTFAHARVSGISSVVPRKEIRLEDELRYFDGNLKKVRRTTKMIGIDCRRVADPGVTAADLCQQAAEKALKSFLISKDIELQRTHDLGLLAELCQTASEFPEAFLEGCDELTPYGVKIRYPQELDIAERHATRALEQAEAIYSWIEAQLRN